MADESLHSKVKARFERIHVGFLPLLEREWDLVFSTLKDPTQLQELLDTVVEESTFRKLELTFKALIWDVLRPLSLRSENDWQSVADELRRLGNQFPLAPMRSLQIPPVISQHLAEYFEGKEAGVSENRVDVTSASRGAPSPYVMQLIAQSIDLPFTVSRAWLPHERSEHIGPYPLKRVEKGSVEILLPHCPHQFSEGTHTASESLKTLACILQIHWAWGRIQNFIHGLCIEHRIPERPTPQFPCEIKLFVPH